MRCSASAPSCMPENFFGRIAAWCEAHGIAMSGHVDQEEPRNPVGVQGDLMKVFKHQHIPGIDDIWFTGRSNVSYKVVSSAAFNYDRPLMMAETYAAYMPGQTTPRIAYRDGHGPARHGRQPADRQPASQRPAIHVTMGP